MASDDLQTRQDALQARGAQLGEPDMAPTTRSATEAHMRSWLRWNLSTSREPDKASPADLVAWIAHLELVCGWKAASIRKALQAVGRWHRHRNLYDPTDSKLVSGALSRLARDHAGEGTSQARNISPAEVTTLVKAATMDPYNRGVISDRGARNAALFAVMYAAALRANEAVALNVDDVDPWADTRGMVVRIRRSKTDQVGVGQLVPVYYAHNVHVCPVRLIVELKKRLPSGGPLFRRMSKHGGWTARRLQVESVNYLLRDALKAAHLDDTTSHGLRRGAATQLARASGGSLDAVANLLRHENLEQSRRYVDDGNPWARVPDLLGL